MLSQLAMLSRHSPCAGRLRTVSCFAVFSVGVNWRFVWRRLASDDDVRWRGRNCSGIGVAPPYGHDASGAAKATLSAACRAFSEGSAASAAAEDASAGTTIALALGLLASGALKVARS